MGLIKKYRGLRLFNKTSAVYNDVHAQLTTSKRGFDRRVNVDYMGEPSYSDAKRRTFAISPKSGFDYFEFWSGGIRYEKTTKESLACPDVTGTYYWYFDTSGDLQVALNGTISDNTFVLSAICGMAYYNKEAGTFEGAVDEQHGNIMDGETHLNMHLTKKFSYVSGGEITGLVDGASEYAGISTGTHMDEDIPNVSIASIKHSFMYRSGAGESTAGWVFTTPDSNVGYKDGGSNVVFNEWDGSAWVLTQSSYLTNYIIYLFGKSNLAKHAYVKVIGQQVYVSRANARAGLLNSLKAIKLQGFPSAEFEWQWAYICKRDGTLEDDGKGNPYIDLRGIKIETLDN